MKAAQGRKQVKCAWKKNMQAGYLKGVDVGEKKKVGNEL